MWRPANWQQQGKIYEAGAEAMLKALQANGWKPNKEDSISERVILKLDGCVLDVLITADTGKLLEGTFIYIPEE